MSKLEGVKLIDVEGGVVKTIEYDGSKYKAVDARVDSGDIVQADRHLDTEQGAFYLVGEKYEGKPAIIDDAGDKRSYFDGFQVFRKIVERESENPARERVDVRE